MWLIQAIKNLYIFPRVWEGGQWTLSDIHIKQCINTILKATNERMNWHYTIWNVMLDKDHSKLLDDLWSREDCCKMENDLPPNREYGIIIHNLKTASGDKYTPFTFQFTLSGLEPSDLSYPAFSPNQTKMQYLGALVRALWPVLPPEHSGGIRQFRDMLRSVTSAGPPALVTPS